MLHGSAIESSGAAGIRLIRTPGDEDATVRVMGLNAGPVWAPDSTRLVGTKGSGLIVYGRDGATIAELGPADEGTPSWQRVAQ